MIRLFVGLMVFVVVACAQPPNVVLIVVDDLGYGDVLGPDRSEDAKTPNIDALFEASTLHTNAYVTAPICNASRIAITTGRYQQRTGTYWYGSKGIPKAGVPTLAETLRKAGYATGLVGKVHHGGNDRIGQRDHPMKHGYDRFYGFFGGTKHFLQHNNSYKLGAAPGPMVIDEKKVEVDGFSTELFGEKARDFVAEHKDKPFFLHLSFNAVHNYCHQLPDDYLKAHGLEGIPDYDLKKEGLWDWRARVSYPNHQEGRAWYLGQLHYLDLEIGRLTAHLEALGIADNTVVVFVSDNGGSLVTYAKNGVLSGGKYTLLEGGVRVPMSIRFPSKFASKTRVASTVSSLDLYPTICELVGVTSPKNLDGLSLLQSVPERRPLFWNTKKQSAVRYGKWKLLKTAATPNARLQITPTPKGTFLYDLEQDPGEKQDLSGKHPETVAELSKMLKQWQANTH